MKFRVLILSIGLLVSLQGVCSAQQNVTSGALSGRIEDSRGAVISGANVIATNLETKLRLATTSDDEGRYSFPYLRTGAYDLTVEASGFTAFTRQLTLLVGQSLELPIR